MNERPLTILYFGITAPDKSMRDTPYIRGLKERGVVFLDCYDTSRGFRKYFRLMRKFMPFAGRFDLVWVGHSSALAVPLVRLLTRKPVLYNALCPLYDGNIVDRKTYAPFSPRAILIWLVDFVSLHCASALLLETNAQIENVRTVFFVPRRKLYRVFTTVDPLSYHPDPSAQKEAQFTCVFRAWMTPATGTEFIVEAARMLRNENIRFKFYVKGPLTDELKHTVATDGPDNIDIDTKYYEFAELSNLILRGHVYLGQFSDHIRTARTIQFKTVEALAYGLPYITADLPSNRELLSPGENCLFVRPRDARDLADKILLLKNDADLRARLGTSAYALYKQELDPSVLVAQVLDIINGLLRR